MRRSLKSFTLRRIFFDASKYENIWIGMAYPTFNFSIEPVVPCKIGISYSSSSHLSIRSKIGCHNEVSLETLPVANQSPLTRSHVQMIFGLVWVAHISDWKDISLVKVDLNLNATSKQFKTSFSALRCPMSHPQKITASSAKNMWVV